MSDPHGDEPVVTTGDAFEAADAAVILIHGRDRDPDDIIGMTADLPRDGVAYLAPQAADCSWYPEPFQAPIAQNEPGRSSALGVIDELVTDLNRDRITPEHVVILGFSQGACIASEYVAHNPRRYGGLASLSGGIMGETASPADHDGDLEGTPVLVGSTENDPYMPADRVHETAEIFASMNGDVTTQLYPGDAHTINDDELQRVAEMLESLR